MSPTLTVPEIAKAAKEERAHFITQAEENIAFFEGEAQTWREIKRALQAKTGPPARQRSGNGTRTRMRTPARRTRRGAGKTLGTDAVLDSMRRGVGFQSSEIARSLGATGTSTLRRLKELEAAGKVQRHGTGSQLRWMMR